MRQTLDRAWRRRKGGRFEQLALGWLQTQGLHLVHRNYRCKCGEIDLVMREREVLVFVEVRFRGSSSQVPPLRNRRRPQATETAAHCPSFPAL